MAVIFATITNQAKTYFPSGTSASVSSFSTPHATLTGLAGMTAGMVGMYLNLSGAASSGNNTPSGTPYGFLITSHISSSSVVISNSSAVAGDANNGHIVWSLAIPFANPTSMSYALGRGGWSNPGSGAIPRVPDPTLQDLDIIQNPGRYLSITANSTAGNVFFVQKSFIAEDFSILYPPTPAPPLPPLPVVPPSGSTLQQMRCILDFTDFNDIQGIPSTPPGGSVMTPTGTNPQLWELGVFVPPPSGYTNPTSNPSSPLYQGRPNQLMVFYATFNAITKNVSIQTENDVLVAFPVV
jgi:hypothetical protein